MSNWYKKPDTSSLIKLEALGEKISWVKDLDKYYVIETLSSVDNRKKYFGYKNDDGPMYWKINKKDGSVEWTEYVPLMFEKGFDKDPNYDLSVLDPYRS